MDQEQNAPLIIEGIVEEQEKNRRYMAWTCLAALIVFTLFVLIGIVLERVGNDQLQAMSNLIDWVFITFGGIVVVYVTGKTFENILSNRTSKIE